MVKFFVIELRLVFVCYVFDMIVILWFIDFVINIICIV